MRSSLALFMALSAALFFGCAKPSTADTGTAGSSGTGNTTGGSAGTTGTGNSSGTGNTTGSGTAGSVGTGTGGTSGACTPGDPTQLVNAAGWNCDLSTPIMIQGAWYPYGDGTTAMHNSACTPASGNPCTSAGCSIGGTTIMDSTYAAWGCGLGMELSSSGGTSPTKSVYTGPVKCFNITMTGSSGNNVVRIGFTQSPNPPSGSVAPFKEIPAFTSGWTGQVCFSDVTCPSWSLPPMVATATCSKTGTDGTPVDMQIQVSAGSTSTTVGQFGIIVTSVVPVTSGSTGTGGSGGTAICASPSGSGTITQQYGDAHVMCPKDYIVQNNAWGQNPFSGQTLSFGPGAKFKVTGQSGMGTTTPEGYPSIWTGAYNNRSTANSGLPRAISSIAAGSIMTSWTWDATGVASTSSYNAAYDVWFSTGSGGDPTASGPSGGYLMVWYYKPSDNQPIGTTLSNGMGTATIGGKNFSVWYGQNNGKPVVSYVAQQNFNSWTYSLGDFIQDAIKRNCGSGMCLNSSWYLTNVFAGFEIWKGGVGLETTDFGVTVP